MRSLVRFFRRLFARGCAHEWEPFQIVWRRRCRRCGRIEDMLTDHTWASWEEYVGHKGGKRVLPQGGSGTAPARGS
jgi:hypothetical protein